MTALSHSLLIDRFGRRRFVLTGCIGIICCLSGEAAITAQFVDTHSTNRIGLGFGVGFICKSFVIYRKTQSRGLTFCVSHVCCYLQLLFRRHHVSTELNYQETSAE